MNGKMRIERARSLFGGIAIVVLSGLLINVVFPVFEIPDVNLPKFDKLANFLKLRCEPTDNVRLRMGGVEFSVPTKLNPSLSPNVNGWLDRWRGTWTFYGPQHNGKLTFCQSTSDKPLVVESVHFDRESIALVSNNDPRFSMLDKLNFISVSPTLKPRILDGDDRVDVGLARFHGSVPIARCRNLINAHYCTIGSYPEIRDYPFRLDTRFYLKDIPTSEWPELLRQIEIFLSEVLTFSSSRDIKTL
jgi:hypothetical protein